MRRTPRLTLAVAALVLVGSAPGVVKCALGQEGDRLDRARAGLPSASAAALDRIVTEARRQDLPTAPLIDKAVEGMAKGVPPDRIITVVDQLARRLYRSQTLLGDRPAIASDIAAVADALERGVSEDAVRTLRGEARPDESIAQTVHTLADLLDRGVPVGVALDVVSAWRSQGAGQAELRELPSAVERLIREGVLPEKAASAVASAVRGGRRPATAGPPPGVGPKSQGGKGPPGRPPIPPGQAKGKGKGKGNKPPPGSGSSPLP